MQPNQGSFVQPRARQIDNNLAPAIQGVDIRTDVAGPYYLNDLHRAAGGGAKYRPGTWMKNQQAKAPAAELPIGIMTRTLAMVFALQSVRVSGEG